MPAAGQAGFPKTRELNNEVQEGVGLFQATIQDGERFGTGKAGWWLGQGRMGWHGAGFQRIQHRHTHRHSVRMVQPVVLRASRSRCACCTSAKG